VLPRLKFTTSIEEAAANLVWALGAPELAGAGGRYLVDRQVAEASPDASDKAKAIRFWMLATELVNSA
jgi:hypothetical protein